MKTTVKEDDAEIDWTKRHNPRVLDQIVAKYSDWTMQVAERCIRKLPQCADQDSLRSAAWDGLLRAIKGFDGGFKANFKTYASLRIRGSMLDSMRASDPMPRTMRQLEKQRKQVTAELTQQLGRRPTAEEIIATSGMTEKEYRLSLVSASSSNAPNNDQNGKINRPSSVIDTMAAPKRDLEIDDGTFREFVRGVDMDGQTILYLYYYRQASMAAIGSVMGISESRVSQMHSTLMCYLRSVGRERFDF